MAKSEETGNRRVRARSSAPAAKADPESSTAARLRALIKAKVKEKRLRWATRQMMIGRQTVDEFLAGGSRLEFDHLDLFAQFLGTTPAALLAEAVGNSTLIVKVKLGEEFIPAQQRWQAEVEGWRSGIVPSPREDAMLDGEEEEDEATEMRALLDCISRQHLADTIATAQQAAGCAPKKKK